MILKKGDIYVCNTNEQIEDCSFTYGSKYKIETNYADGDCAYVEDDTMESYGLILEFNGEIHKHFKHFIPLNEWRDKQIDMI